MSLSEGARRSVVVRRAGLGLALLLAGCATGAGPELPAVPSPDLSAAEPAVQQQIADKRAALDAALARAGSEPAVAAGAFGDLGLAYLLYDFLDAAGVCFDNARRLDGGDFRWVYLSGYLRRTEGRLPEAVPLFEKAAEMEPDFLPAHLRLGRARLEMGEIDRAETHFQNALEVDPESAAAFEGLGRVAVARGNDTAAVESFRRALVLEPEASGVRYALGQALRRQGDTETAARELEQAGDVPTRIPDPLINPLAAQARSEQFYSMQGAEALEDQDYSSAAASFRALLAQNPASIEGYRGLATSLSGMGDPDGAIEALETALTEGKEDDPDRDKKLRVEIHRRLAGLLEKRGDDPRAIDHLREAIELEPDAPTPHVRLGDLLARTRRFEEALTQFDAALDRLGGASSPVLVRRATVLVNLGRGDQAVADFRRAIEAAPEDPMVRQRFAEALDFLGRKREAQEQRRQAERLAGAGAQRLRLLLHQADGRIDAGDFEAASDLLRQAVDLAPDSVPARDRLARVLAHLGRYDEAVAELDHALEKAPRDLSLRLARIRALVLGYRWGEARVALNEALRLFPRDKDLALLQVRLLATVPDPQVRDGALALEVARRVAKEDASAETRQALALALAASGKPGEAAEIQRDLVAEAERAGDAQHLARLRERLTAFETGHGWIARQPEAILEGL